MPEVVRPWFGRVLAVVIGLICLGVSVTVGLGDGWSDAVLVTPWTALVALACWATFWRPRVAVSDGGVRIVNVTRTLDIPWPAVRDVETKWALTIVTAYGRFVAWSAPAPGVRGAMRTVLVPPRSVVPRTEVPAARQRDVTAGELADTPSGAAAELVRRRWDELRAAGHLDNPRLERERAAVTWHVGSLLAAVALIVLGLVVTAL